MGKARRVTVNLPEDLLHEAMEISGKGITDTLVDGLRLVRQSRAHGRARALRDRLNLDIDLDQSRERPRRGHLPASRRRREDT